MVLFSLQKPESPLWQISSTQSSVTPTTSTLTPSTSVGPVISSSQTPPSSSVSSIPVSHNLPRDEIYIDDEGLEGSGRGEVSCNFQLFFLKNLFLFLL